jgi:hypothetical protein
MPDESDKRKQALLLAAEAGCDHRTATKWLNGESVSRVMETVLDNAATKLGIERPKAGAA